jgi:hypothetical protein
MKTKILFLSFLLPFFISCDEKNNNTDNESRETLSIKGITETDEEGNVRGAVDSDDWNLNKQFTDREKQLFSTIDFTKTGIAEPITNGTQMICFCPNPFPYMGSLYYYQNKHIVSIVIVDYKYNILHRYQFKNRKEWHLDLTTLKEGIYRMYYVMQDENENVVHCGYGDIKRDKSVAYNAL